MIRALPLVLLGACAPKIDAGPVPVRVAAEPVRILEQPAAELPVVYFQAMVAAGSAHDPVGSEGLAHLTAASTIAAGAGDRSAQEVREALATTGNDFELIVDREWVTLRLRCHVDHQALCAELFTDALTEPRFEAADVARLRGEAVYAVEEALRADEEALGAAVLEALIFEGHPYAHPPEGRTGVLPLLDEARVAAFHDRYWVRSAILVGVAGGYAPETIAQVQGALEAAPYTMAPELVLLSPVRVEGRSLAVVDSGAEGTGYHLGHALPVTRDHADWPALHLAFTAFGAHRQSFGRLYRALRGDRGLNYGDYAYIEPYRERTTSSAPEQGVLRRQPHFSLWIRPTTLANGPFALKLALDELERFVANGLTDEELADTRSYLVNHTALLAQDPGRRLAYALEAEATGTPNLLTSLAPALESLTREEVQAAVQRHIRPADLRIVAVSGDPDGLVRALVEEGETPVVYLDMTPSEAVARRDAEVADDATGLSAEAAWTLPAEGIFR